MLLKTRGIVLHAIRYSESSLVVKVFTEQLGLVPYMAKGVRSAKSKNKAALFQPTTLLDMVVTNRSGKNLQYIRELQRAHNYHSMPYNDTKRALGIFMCEVVMKCVHEYDMHQSRFDFVFRAFVELDEADATAPDFHLHFLLGLSRELGFYPHENFSAGNCYFDVREGVFDNKQDVVGLDKAESKLFYELLLSHRQQNQSGMKRAERNHLLDKLLLFFDFHVQRFGRVHSLAVLREVMK